jgi:hypothetical protein
MEDDLQKQLTTFWKGQKNKGQGVDPNESPNINNNNYKFNNNNDDKPPKINVYRHSSSLENENNIKKRQFEPEQQANTQQAQTQQQEEMDEDEEPKIEINEEQEIDQEIDKYHKNIIQEFGSQQRDLLFNEVYLKKNDISYDDINTYINDDLNFFKKTFFEVEEKMTYRNYFDSIRSKLDDIIKKDENCENIKEGEYGQYESNVKNRKICNVVNESIKKLKTNFTFDNFKKFITKNKNNPTNNSQTNNGQKINQTNQNDNSFSLDFINTNNGIELSTIEINGTTFVVDKLFGPDVNLHNLALSIKKITLFNGKLTKFKNNKTNGGKTIKKHKRNRNKKITNKYNERRRRFTDEFLKIST